MAFTTVGVIGFLPCAAGGAHAGSTAGAGTDNKGAAGAGHPDETALPETTIAGAGLRAVSRRVRHRGHHWGAPSRRAPQLGQLSTMSVSARGQAKLSLKGRGRPADETAVTILGLPVAFLVAWLAYREAARHQKEYGKAPWNISPMTWAVIVFFSGLVIGGILLLVARRADQKAGTGAGTEPAGELFSRPPAGPVTTPSGRGRMGSVL